jgi:hypothetical protein
MTPDERRALIDSYGDASYRRVADALERFPSDRRRTRPSPTEWTAHEIAVHLCDNETNAYVRIRKSIAEPGGAVASFDEQRWQQALGYHETDIDEVLALLRMLRRQTHRVLESLPADAWSRACEHPESGTLTVADLVREERDHLAAHVAQIEALAAAFS